MRKLSLILLVILCAAHPECSRAAEAPQPGNNVIHLLGLRRGNNPSKAELDAVAAEANAIYARLGVDIKVFMAKKDPEDAHFLEGWDGGLENPEQSQNDFYYGGDVMGGRVVAVDVSGYEAYGKRYGWTKTQAGALLLVHGTGHNSDSDNKLKHNDAGIMLDGNVREMYTSKADNSYAVTTSKAKNPRLISYLIGRYR